jgi:hypothetical protein
MFAFGGAQSEPTVYDREPVALTPFTFGTTGATSRDEKRGPYSAAPAEARLSQISKERSVALRLPSSAEEGWLRDQRTVAKHPYSAQTGWCW